MKEYKKYIIIIPIIVLIVIISIHILNQNSEKEEQIEEINLEEKEEKNEIKKIKVDVKGEVKKPGIQELNESDRVGDAIKKAGGLTENADTELINLSKTLKDEMVIIIYNKNEIEKIKNEKPETVIKYIEKKCECPDTINEACIKEKTSTKEELKDTKISINKASLEELMKVEGIGESKAKAIIKYRETNGNFETIEDIKKVSGIGESTFEKFKDYITV